MSFTATAWGLSTDVSDWRYQAACRTGVDPELFFAHGRDGPALRRIFLAKQICHGCPVARECLKWAEDNKIAEGVWGGKTPDERRGIAFPATCWCQRCHGPFTRDADNPYARICPDCADTRRRDLLRELHRERFGPPPQGVEG